MNVCKQAVNAKYPDQRLPDTLQYSPPNGISAQSEQNKEETSYGAGSKVSTLEQKYEQTESNTKMPQACFLFHTRPTNTAPSPNIKVRNKQFKSSHTHVHRPRASTPAAGINSLAPRHVFVVPQPMYQPRTCGTCCHQSLCSPCFGAACCSGDGQDGPRFDHGFVWSRHR